MDKSTIIILCAIGFSIGFIIYWFTSCKENYNDFFSRKDEHEDPKTHYITETIRERTFKDKIRATLYVIRQSVVVGFVGAIFLGGGASMLVSKCSSNYSSSSNDDYEDYEYFDDAHRPDHF